MPNFSTGFDYADLAYWKGVFESGNYVADIFDNTMPVSPNSAPGIAPMGTTGALAWAAIDTTTPVLQISAPASYTPVRTGTMSWLRIRATADTNAASTTQKRIDMKIGVTTGEARVGNPVVDSTTIARTIDELKLFF